MAMDHVPIYIIYILHIHYIYIDIACPDYDGKHSAPTPCTAPPCNWQDLRAAPSGTSSTAAAGAADGVQATLMALARPSVARRPTVLEPAAA